MTANLLATLESKPPGIQLVVLTLIFDPIGAALGYLLHPQLGVDPITGVVYGIVAAGILPTLWVLRQS